MQTIGRQCKRHLREGSDGIHSIRSGQFRHPKLSIGPIVALQDIQPAHAGTTMRQPLSFLQGLTMNRMSPKERVEKTICATLPSMYAHWARRNQRLLVLNAGLGFHLESLWEAGFDITAHATTAQGLERAQGILGQRAEYMLSQPDSLMCDDNFFDYAFYLGTLENPDPIVTRKTLEELHRVTVSGLVVIFANTFSFLNAGTAFGSLMNLTNPIHWTKRANQKNAPNSANSTNPANLNEQKDREGREDQKTRKDLSPPCSMGNSKDVGCQEGMGKSPESSGSLKRPGNMGNLGNLGNLGDSESLGNLNTVTSSEKPRQLGKKALYATAYPTCNPFTIRQLVTKEFPKSRFRWFFISTPPQFLRHSPRWRRASHHLLRWCPFNAIYAVRIDFSPQPGTTGLVLRANNIHA